ncbi:hypothetical protein J2S08_001283 [Bacillus chungangensis]|uniref:Serine dehydratase n=1 Tax=Bacillus chungangensis TaxID=587633 RepID=A0ABT9WQ82_9BACI|nr:hypothetical protein [Bacillus chungangensis]
MKKSTGKVVGFELNSQEPEKAWNFILTFSVGR